VVLESNFSERKLQNVLNVADVVRFASRVKGSQHQLDILW